ncbi:MAG TPA: hypothetical protein VFU36_15030 [Jatrophihabitans sp.]|nr:hypothetical protein [Jatrophihabitans sp.]
MMLDGMMSDPSGPAAVRRLLRGRRLRWLLPLLAACVAALVVSGLLSANANPSLPSRSSGQLLAAISNPKQVGFSGTVVENASLGLPDLGDLGMVIGGSGTSPLSLLSGSHTIRVWYGSPTKQRIALLAPLGELDLFRNGNSLWQWDSDTRTAVHRSLPSDSGLFRTPEQLPNLSPDQAAQRITAMLGPSTTVTIEHNAQVAGRSAYVLVLAPKQAGSLIGTVRISVDGATLVPLAVQLYARNGGGLLLDVAFTRFTVGTPSEDNFDWTPPAGVTVQRAPSETSLLPGLPLSGAKVTEIGSGWTEVYQVTGLPSATALAKANPRVAALLALLPPVKGSWGTGRLLQSPAFSALITDDGRAFAGAVDPSVLYADAAK